MRKLVLVAALSAMALVWGVSEASARHCGGHHHGGCGGGGGCGMSCGGCGGWGGCGGGGGCYSGGCGGHCDAGYGWSGGYCYVDGGAPYTAIAAAPADAQEATLVVTLPADARLKVDDHATTTSSSERTFTTPPLKVGQEYHYTLMAEVNGRSVSREVTVRGGETTRVHIDIPVEVAAK